MDVGITAVVVAGSVVLSSVNVVVFVATVGVFAVDVSVCISVVLVVCSIAVVDEAIADVIEYDDVDVDVIGCIVVVVFIRFVVNVADDVNVVVSGLNVVDLVLLVVGIAVVIV